MISQSFYSSFWAHTVLLLFLRKLCVMPSVVARRVQSIKFYKECASSPILLPSEPIQVGEAKRSQLHTVKPLVEKDQGTVIYSVELPQYGRVWRRRAHAGLIHTNDWMIYDDNIASKTTAQVLHSQLLNLKAKVFLFQIKLLLYKSTQGLQVKVNEKFCIYRED